MARKVIISISILAVAGLVGAAILRYEATRKAHQLCQVCTRPIHSGTGYRLALAKGSEVACCPRCGMHFALQHPGAVQAAYATDFYSGTEVPATIAYYVEGGDEEHCASVQPLVRKEQQGSASLAFDRCLPTVVAFAKESDAQKYRTEHGGKILSYAQAMENVAQR